MLGLSEKDVTALQPDDLQNRLGSAYRKMFQVGAHYVVDGIADCIDVIEEINTRLKSGGKP
jgi:phosphonoacetaldehyde hydrolase